jgi:hypothetical protein
MARHVFYLEQDVLHGAQKVVCVRGGGKHLLVALRRARRACLLLLRLAVLAEERV